MKTTTYYVTTIAGLKTRRRANLLFSRTWTRIDVIDATDEEVAAKQLAGAYVVNERGLRAILDDASGTGGLQISTVAPTPPPPEELPRPPGPALAPEAWRELAADIALHLPQTHQAAAPVMRAALDRRAEGGDKVSGRVWKRFAALMNDVVDGQVGDEARRLRHALADAVPLQTSPSVFGEIPTLELGVLAPYSWASNVATPRWMTQVALELGIPFPPFVHPGGNIESAETKYMQELAAIADTPEDRIEGGRAEGRVRAKARHAEELAAIVRSRRMQELTWCEQMEDVRKNIAVSLRLAYGRARTAIGRFAIGELARAAWGLPCSPALTEETALPLALGEGLVLPSPEAFADATRTSTVRLWVRCKNTIKTRRRAGLIIGQEPQIFEVDEGVAAELLRDDGLIVSAVADGPYAKGATLAQLRAGLATMSAEEIEAELARRRAEAAKDKSSDEPTQEAAPARATPAIEGEPRIGSKRRRERGQGEGEGGAA